MAKYMVKKGSPHIIMFNKNFENDSDYVLLPDDFDINGYQKHMTESRGKPTKTVRAFFKSKPTPIPEETDWDKFKAKENSKPEFADELKEELNIVEEPAIVNEISVIPEFENVEPAKKDLILMKKSQIVEIGNELGLNLGEDMLKVDLIAKVKEFFDEKEKTNDMKKINEDRVFGI